MTKPMSEAFKKIDTYRDELHANKEKIQSSDFSTTVYFYFSERLNRPYAIGYAGRSKKSAFHYRYGSVEERQTSVQEWMDALQKKSSSKAEVKRDYKEGDVLYTSWGYEQTNIDYFKVLSLVGKSSIELVEIGKENIGDTNGTCIPNPDKIVGKPIRKRLNKYGVNISPRIIATKLEPKIIHGCKIYTPQHYSSIH